MPLDWRTVELPEIKTNKKISHSTDFKRIPFFRSRPGGALDTTRKACRGKFSHEFIFNFKAQRQTSPSNEGDMYRRFVHFWYWTKSRIVTSCIVILWGRKIITWRPSLFRCAFVLSQHGARSGIPTDLTHFETQESEQIWRSHPRQDRESQPSCSRGFGQRGEIH